MARKPRPFSDYFKRYEKPQFTYDTSQGFGSVEDWRAAWDSMGHAEATARVGKNDLLSILGLDKLPTSKDALKRHFHKLMLKHQDWHRQIVSEEDQTKLKEMIAAYTLLRLRLK